MSNPELDPITSKTTNTEITPLQKIEGFQKLVNDASTAMLVTRSESGTLHSRAMAPCRRTFPLNLVIGHPLTAQQQLCQRNSACSLSPTMPPTSSTRSSTTQMSMCLSMTKRLPDGQVSLASRKSPRTRISSRNFGLQCSSEIPVLHVTPSLTVWPGSRLSSVISRTGSMTAPRTTPEYP